MSLQSDLLKAIEDAESAFERALPGIQERIFNELLSLVKSLKTDSLGNVVPSSENLRKIAEIRARTQDIILSDDYVDAVTDFGRSFNKVTDIQTALFLKTITDFSPSLTVNTLKQVSVSNVVDSLTNTGINADILDKLDTLLRNNIVENRPFSDLVDELKVFIEGNKNVPGRLKAFAGQVVTDGLNQYSASYSKLITDDLGLEWFQYVGGLVKDSRPFCMSLVQKQWVHKSELSKVARGEFDPAPGSLAGMIPGTNGANLQVNRGGYNCRHLLLPVSSEFVPKEIREKFENRQ